MRAKRGPPELLSTACPAEAPAHGGTTVTQRSSWAQPPGASSAFTAAWAGRQWADSVGRRVGMGADEGGHKASERRRRADLQPPPAPACPPWPHRLLVGLGLELRRDPLNV